MSFAHYHGQHEDLRMEDHKDFQRETAPSLVDTKEVEELRNMLEETMLPFLMYMTRVQPDIAQQLMVNISVTQTTKLVNY